MSSPLTGPLQDVSRTVVETFGQPVVFRRTIAGTHNPETETFTAPTETQIEGHAVQGRGDKDTYLRLGLVYARHPTLVFAPGAASAGELPVPGDVVEWAGHQYTVAEVLPISPAGTPLLGRVVCR